MKSFFAALILSVCFQIQAINWECVSDSDCSEAMRCIDELCRTTQGMFSDYAQVEIKIGENSPVSGGSQNLFTPNPSKDIVLGQFDIKATQNGADGKYFILTEVNAFIPVSNSEKIKGSNFRLVYDRNGNGLFDSSDVVLSQADSAVSSRVKFEVDQKNATYQVNKSNYFLVVADFDFDGVVNNLFPFGLEFSAPASDFSIMNAGNVFIISSQKIIFTSFMFEPDSGYFVFTSGEHFPNPPEWKNMNRLLDVMHLRLKSIDGNNELKSITIRTMSNSMKFGENVKRVLIYHDKNGDGKGDELISERSFSVGDDISSVKIDIPQGSLNFNQGDEKRVVISVELFLYNGQSAQFRINDNEVVLQNMMKFAGLPVSSRNFKYECDESDAQCNVLVEENVDEGGDEGGCSLLFF